MKKKYMAGIDLHGNNMFIAIMDKNGRRVFEKKLPCKLETLLEELKPYKEDLEAVAVESTFNWYWLVDGLQDAGYDVNLANPAKIAQYSGLKYTDDKSDAFHLAELLRLGILPVCYICDRKWRSVRDMLRRRMGLVQKRTSLYLSLKSLHTRTTGETLTQGQLKGLDPEKAAGLFTGKSDQMVAKIETELISKFNESIEVMEKELLKEVKEMPFHRVLETLPGVGRILGMTIALETVDPARFAGPGNYASYCRCVDSQCVSNGKKKGENNQKCGNKYLAWAFVEGANFAKRYDLRCRRYFDRKAAKTNTSVATKALACKLAKAAWHMMSKQTSYDAERMFAGETQKTGGLEKKETARNVSGVPMGGETAGPLGVASGKGAREGSKARRRRSVPANETARAGAEE